MTGNTSFEYQLWAAADKMRGHVDTSHYKQLVLSLIFLKAISIRSTQLIIPEGANWLDILAQKAPEALAETLDQAMRKIEHANPILYDALSVDFEHIGMHPNQLYGLLQLIESTTLQAIQYKGNHTEDILGRIYEYFLGRFATVEGRGGGEFYTPHSIVELMVEMLQPANGVIYDPCCGAGSMFVQSELFRRLHKQTQQTLHIYGQESNYTTWRLCKMNLALHNISHDIGIRNADSFHDDLFPTLRANYIMANPPFNMSGWGREFVENDKRWVYGLPPIANANYAWLQHIIHHLAEDGVAMVVLSNGSLSSRKTVEFAIRKKLIEARLVEAIIALPDRLFYATPIAACLWVLRKSRKHDDTLFINASALGKIVSRQHRELESEEIYRVSKIYHAFINHTCEPESSIHSKVDHQTIINEQYNLVPQRYLTRAHNYDIAANNETLETLIFRLEEVFKHNHESEKHILSSLHAVTHGE
jgi:type I restriction enzyme M protein